MKMILSFQNAVETSRAEKFLVIHQYRRADNFEVSWASDIDTLPVTDDALRMFRHLHMTWEGSMAVSDWLYPNEDVKYRFGIQVRMDADE